MDSKLKAWCEEGKHLPKIMRDFHAQKDIFKTMHDLTDVAGHEYAKDISFVKGQCYIIDIFLWFMARHGYTLQKSRAPIFFEDLDTNVRAAMARRNDAMTCAMRLTPVGSPASANSAENGVAEQTPQK